MWLRLLIIWLVVGTSWNAEFPYRLNKRLNLKHYTNGTYCALNCFVQHPLFPDEFLLYRNYMCPCTVVPRCSESYKFDNFGIAERLYILHAHNKWRDRVSSGRLTTWPGRPGILLTLDYDLELEAAARCQAKQCFTMYGSCRKTKRFAWYGQNIYGKVYAANQSRYSLEFLLDEALWDWYKTISNLTVDVIKSYKSGKWDRFTQLAWANTAFVGCAKTQFRDDQGFLMEQIICNYGPQGNVEGEPVFKLMGPADFKCPHPHRKSRIYLNLCGDIEYTADLNRYHRHVPSPLVLLAGCIAYLAV